jgi:hypothetical protein
MLDNPPRRETWSGYEAASKEIIDERPFNCAGDCRRLVFAPDLHPAETGNIHLTEKFLSGDKRL